MFVPCTLTTTGARSPCHAAGTRDSQNSCTQVQSESAMKGTAPASRLDYNYRVVAWLHNRKQGRPARQGPQPCRLYIFATSAN